MLNGSEVDLELGLTVRTPKATKGLLLLKLVLCALLSVPLVEVEAVETAM
jgi:hypothetical protein